MAMKMIFAIVNKDDSNTVQSALTREGYSATKLATTGGFLMSGNTTFLVGTEDNRVDDVIAIIEKHSKKRTQMVPSTTYGGVSAADPLLSGGGDGGRRHHFRAGYRAVRKGLTRFRGAPRRGKEGGPVEF